MLVLSRRVGERIRVGHDVVIEIVEVRDGRVKIGVTAPEEVAVWRQEVIDRSPELSAA